MIMQVTLDGTGYAMLLDSNGDIIIHPGDFGPNAEGEFLNIGTMANGWYRNLWNHINVSTDYYEITDTAGERKYYAASPVDMTGWFLVTILPRSVTTQPIVDLLSITIPITLALMILIGVAMYIIVGKLINRPINALADIADNVTRGNLNVNIDTSSDDEMGILAKGFAGIVSLLTTLPGT
jgi:methyl-accepting chemotaxis protein